MRSFAPIKCSLNSTPSPGALNPAKRKIDRKKTLEEFESEVEKESNDQLTDKEDARLLMDCCCLSVNGLLTD